MLKKFHVPSAGRNFSEAMCCTDTADCTAGSIKKQLFLKRNLYSVNAPTSSTDAKDTPKVRVRMSGTTAG